MGGTNIFKVLADGQRREILMMLKDGRLKRRRDFREIADYPSGTFLSFEIIKRC